MPQAAPSATAPTIGTTQPGTAPTSSVAPAVGPTVPTAPTTQPIIGVAPNAPTITNPVVQPSAVPTVNPAAPAAPVIVQPAAPTVRPAVSPTVAGTPTASPALSPQVLNAFLYFFPRSAQGVCEELRWATVVVFGFMIFFILLLCFSLICVAAQSFASICSTSCTNKDGVCHVLC